MEKVGVFWKKPYFFFKRLKLYHLRKSRAFSKKALLFPEKALLFRLKLRTQKSSAAALLSKSSGSMTQFISCYTLGHYLWTLGNGGKSRSGTTLPSGRSSVTILKNASCRTNLWPKFGHIFPVRGEKGLTSQCSFSFSICFSHTFGLRKLCSLVQLLQQRSKIAKRPCFSFELSGKIC